MRCMYMPTTAPAIETVEGFEQSLCDWVPRTLPRADPPVDDDGYNYSDDNHDSRTRSSSNSRSTTETDDAGFLPEVATSLHDGDNNNHNDNGKKINTNRDCEKSRTRSVQRSRVRRDQKEIPCHIFTTHSNDPPIPVAAATVATTTASTEKTTVATTQKKMYALHFIACLTMLLIPGLTVALVYYFLGFENDR
mmetsp:Transcript_5510/g.12819  ORF Transcript_5510/g.12819 Transcript_5510/m.12819 type:complete len:193 (-) Transcript_5510:822-1400(-)